MNNPRLLILNTIGLTGVEVLLTELSRVPGILALPGQNFSMFGHNLYRPHDYTKHSAADVFESLNRILRTKDGRIWMGLTKHMTSEESAAYPKEKHRELFLARLGADRDFLEAIRAYALAFFEAIGVDTGSTVYLTFYANNVVLNSSHYPRFEEKVTVVNLFCRPSRWLAMISHTRTWDCTAACRFWILNNLFLRYYASTHQNNIACCYDDLVDNPGREIEKITNLLDLPNTTVRSEPSRVPGMVTINTTLIEAQKENDAALRAIYKDYNYFQMAEQFDEWAPEFLRAKRIQELLQKYARFWNSTSHTNFDWIGPVGEEIVEEAARFFPRTTGRNLSFDFYHRYFLLNSDNYDRPVAHLEHFLGCLEDEVVIPKLPYFLKVAMEYLISVSNNNINLRHSYSPIRDASIYRRLGQPEYQSKIVQFGLAERMREVDQKITKADAACTSAI